MLSRGAGSTKAGEPYEAMLPEKYGNLCVRHVIRPQIISNYLEYSNCADLNNQSRQFDLALGNRWITQSTYFRFYTTMVGITAFDAWKASRFKENVHMTVK